MKLEMASSLTDWPLSASFKKQWDICLKVQNLMRHLTKSIGHCPIALSA